MSRSRGSGLSLGLGDGGRQARSVRTPKQQMEARAANEFNDERAGRLIRPIDLIQAEPKSCNELTLEAGMQEKRC